MIRSREGWHGRCLFVVVQPIMATKRHEGIDAYLAGVPATHRATLKKLRGQIKKLYPKATEHLSYCMPLFKLDGHQMAGFRAAKRHSWMCVWSGTRLAPRG